MWRPKPKWDNAKVSSNRILFILAMLLIGGGILYHHFTRNIASEKTDLVKREGTLKSYVFENGRKGSRHYVLHTSEYPAALQIKADFTDDFNKAGFEDRVKAGARVLFSVHKNDTTALITEGSVFIYSVQVNNEYFLKEETITADNNPLALLGGLGFTLVGLTVLAYTIREARKRSRAKKGPIKW